MFVKFCWVVTIAITAFAAFHLVADLAVAASAPQQAAAAAIAAATAIVPYVFTRACEGVAQPAAGGASATVVAPPAPPVEVA